MNDDPVMIGYFSGHINGVLGIWHFNIHAIDGRMTWVVDGVPLHESVSAPRITDATAMLNKIVTPRIKKYAQNPV